MEKNEKEIKFIMKAASIANLCIPFIEELLKKENIREKEIALNIEKKIKKLGGKPAFKTLIACGERASNIHAKPTMKYVKGMGYIDFGISFKGYKVDVTVPFVKCEIGNREKKMVNTLIEAYELAKRSIKVGVNCFSVFEIVDNFLRKRGYKMVHSLGHGIGKKVHELPIIGIPRHKLRKLKKKKIEKLKKIKFENRMVFTIEPGIYVKRLGGCRIENTFLILNNRLKELTKARLIEC